MPTQIKKTVLDLNSNEAKKYFLKNSSYCSIDFPKYITFQKILNNVSTFMGSRGFSDFANGNSVKLISNVNYKIFNNKDGKYSWRPLELINPVLYVSLVNLMTEPLHWDFIKNRFSEFGKISNINCCSIPVLPKGKQSDQASQVLAWLDSVESGSIQKSLKYKYVLKTDIVDCYGAIYTHSITWALHGKSAGKGSQLKRNLLGDKIDNHIQAMRHGQTNGIPQGSSLMDFISEMVLGYVDETLYGKLKDLGINDFHIIRYRDDYRVFFNDSTVGEIVIKILTETAIDVGFKINTSKTMISDNVIENAVKKDKIEWFKIKSLNILNENHSGKLLMFCIALHQHSMHFPNCGSLMKGLSEIENIISKKQNFSKISMQVTAIISDIAFRNPRAYHVCCAIISRMLVFVNKDKRIAIIKDIILKFSTIPNTCLMMVWLQRVIIKFDKKIEFDAKICRIVSGKTDEIWDSSWCTSIDLKKYIASKNIVSKEKLKLTPLVVAKKEVQFFNSY